MMPEVDSECKEYKKDSNFKIVKAMKSLSKTILNQLLLSINFDAKY